MYYLKILILSKSEHDGSTSLMVTHNTLHASHTIHVLHFILTSCISYFSFYECFIHRCITYNKQLTSSKSCFISVHISHVTISHVVHISQISSMYLPINNLTSYYSITMHIEASSEKLAWFASTSLRLFASCVQPTIYIGN